MSEQAPLAGVRVVEIVGIGPGPFAAMLLADLGAEVIRIDRPGGALTSVADPTRDILGRGRLSVALDLKADGAADVVLQLVEHADLLLEGFRPGVTERLGIGPEACLKRNSALVYGRVTGWGQDGPLAERAGHDVNYLSISGALGAIGRAGGAPQIPLNLVGDFAGGSLYLVVGLLAGLARARSTGTGGVVDAAMVDGVAHLQASITSMVEAGDWSVDRGTNLLDSGAPFYDVYRTIDGEYMAVGAIEPAFYRQMLEGLDLHELPDREDRQNWPVIRNAIASRFEEATREHWTTVFEKTDACVTPVLDLVEAREHPHNVARNTYRQGDDALVQPAPAPRFVGEECETPYAPRRPGGDTAEALARWGVLGVDDLIGRGIVHLNPGDTGRRLSGGNLQPRDGQ